MTLAQLRSSPRASIGRLISRRGGANVDELLVAQPSAFKGIAALAGKARCGCSSDQLLVRSLDSYADVLPKAVNDESFAFYGTKLNGTPQNQPRWKRAVDFTTNILTDDVSEDLRREMVPAGIQGGDGKLVDNIIGAMGRRIENLTGWRRRPRSRPRPSSPPSPRDRLSAQWHDYDVLGIDRDDLFGNAMRANQFDHDYNIGKLGKPIIAGSGGSTPMTVNAQANFGLVAITFPAAILQPPFFDPNADPAVNYGGIGAVIGHEMSHHFDDQGSKYDAHGNLVDWWTPQDVASFKRLSEELVKQYDAYEVFPGAHVKGEFTLGENIGDLAGGSVAYDAYHASLGGKEPPVIDGTTGDQRFYLGWAQVWRRNYREANLRAAAADRPACAHPASRRHRPEFRRLVSGVRH